MRSHSTDGSGVAGLISGLIIWWLVLREGGITGSGAQLDEVGLSHRKQSLGMCSWGLHLGLGISLFLILRDGVRNGNGRRWTRAGVAV